MLVDPPTLQAVSATLRVGPIGKPVGNMGGDIFFNEGSAVLSFHGIFTAGGRQGGVAMSGDTATGPAVFYFRGRLKPSQGTMSLQDLGGGRVQLTLWLENQTLSFGLERTGSLLRHLRVTPKVLSGVTAPADAITRTSVQAALARAEIACIVDPPALLADQFANQAMLSVQQLHQVMAMDLNAQHPGSGSAADPDAWRLHCLFARGFSSGRSGGTQSDVIGVMYDTIWMSGQGVASPPRQGFAVFLHSKLLTGLAPPPGGRGNTAQDVEKEREWQRQLRYTMVHEIGHALNLPHAFPSRSRSASWMNYPEMYAGREAAFWTALDHSGNFDETELDFLRYAPIHAIAPGGNQYGPQGAYLSLGDSHYDSSPFYAAASRPRSLHLTISPLKPIYAFGEPVFLRLALTNRGRTPAQVRRAFDPTDRLAAITIAGPGGRTRRIAPPFALLQKVTAKSLAPGETWDFDGIFAAYDSEGPLFAEPGLYGVAAGFAGVKGAPLFAPAAQVRILPPSRAEEYFAYRLWDDPQLMRALYLRRPLLAADSWRELTDVFAPPLAADPRNRTVDYLAYVSALGWREDFEVLRSRRIYKADQEKAAARVARLRFDGLPSSVMIRSARMVQEAIEGKATGAR